MSDKSFGDCTNRNVVKNPLLSTAVTGLSIEDLTHNAVLLPAVPSQELITIQDQQNEAQNITLRHLDHDITNFPSGDAASYQTQFKSPPHVTKSLIDNQKQTQYIKNNDNQITTKSKASLKTDDDFDVNEYFARLQGTRYVSAPLNSHLKEDQNANLPAEENLEEINLNEPEKKPNQDDFQHSLTADIAQNFSQLPSVLPQVASVVFSSFSNMLNLKSREQTPDEVKMYQHAQIPEMTVPLAVPEPPAQAMPPPLKEPPVSGNTSNYRITTKKKVYAQIPGLSSGDNQIHTYNTAPVGQVPYYFTPEPMVSENKQESFHTSFDKSQSRQDVDRIQVKSIQGTEETFDAFNKKTDELSRDVLFQPEAIADHEIKITNPVNEFHQETVKREIEDTKVHENINQSEVETIRSNISSSNQNREESYIPDSLFSSVRNNEIPFSIGKSQVDLNQSSNQFVPISQVPTSIIPPPPMFSSFPRKDSQSTGNSVLPPSVARRIGSNQPVIKSFTKSNPILPENIFTPNIMAEQCTSGDMHTNVQQHDQQDPLYNIPIGPNRNDTDTKISSTDYFGSSSSITSGFHPFVQTTTASQNVLNESVIAPPKTTDISSITRLHKDLSKAEKEEENRMPISNIYQLPYDNNKYPANIEDNNKAHQVVSEPNIAPSIFFNPTSLTQSDIGSYIAVDQSQLAAQNKVLQFYTNDFAAEPPKGVSEPPKVSSNLNYRMTKKRPQYYSGPIEGLGSISNNIKPTINPIQPNAYHGALFNPDQGQSGHNLPVVYDTPNRQEPLAPFDISRPINLPIESTNESYISQQTTQTDFNTAFDLSRPTTERHEQTQSQESKGFGIIGSLKSKFSSIDINKIQNTVTTFFDPAYNEPKTDAHKEKESNLQTFSGNYQNFPQHEDASLEVFVPNIEHTGYQTANPYNYQMQTLQTYQNQQYYPNQEYFNQSHDYSKDYYSGYHENLNKPVTGANISNVAEESRSGNDNIDIKTQSTNVLTTQADTASILEVKRKTIDNVSQITEKTKSVFDDFTVGTKRDENVLGFLNPLVDSDNKQKIVETKITDSFLGKYYGPSKTDLQPPTSLFKEINTDDIHRDIKEQDTPNIDIIHQLQSVADSTLKNVFDCKSPIVVESVLAKDIQEDFPIISNVAIDTSFTPFFDYQKPIFAIPDTNNIKQSIIDHPVNVDSSHTFFDLQAPISNSLPRNKDDCNILNSATTQNATIGKTREMLSGPTDFNSLCPLLQSKSENLQTYASAAFAEKTSLNETPLFSLFEQPSLLPPLPSFDLSKISSISLPVPIKESIEIKNLETKLDNVSLYDNTENVIKFERKSSFFDKTLPVEDDTVYVDNQVSDLNICETCREVNKPEEKEADLTTQLIENITAPIQLANPVEFPVIASTSVPDISDFSNQFAEISYIPEDIIETMKQPPSVELKEDNFNSAITFGWSTGDSLPTKVTTDHDYSFQNDPNIIGFFDEKSLFFENVPTNASDEIKAEYKISQEDTIVLPRQLSIPTAPPEEDSNSDESGLDVHSIEQDAKNDFPIYEEFVIEPSETDDDKIEFKERERYSEDSPQEVDTFTNRVERFKQMETSTDLPDVNETQKATNALSLGTSSSPAITIASYFDTGNYAVENHYKNSLTSPPSVSFGANISSSTSIPPGFEEEYKRKCSGISSKDIPIGLNVGDIIFVPDTTTQTTVTACLTFTQPSNTVPTNVVTTDVSTRTTSFVPETVLNKTERLPAFSSIIKPKSETIEHEDKLSLVEKKATGTKPINDTSSEPINFFSSNEESNVNSDVYNNFSRLSSYFTTPPKPEHSKSFFELSQSQNHYRHKPDQFNSIQSKVKDFFDSSDLPKTESPDIPQNYLASMNLVRDLASHKTVTPKEDVVKIVNYFTVSYDIDNRNIGEPKSSIDITEKNIDKNTDGLTNRNYLYELGDIDETHFCIEDLLKQCSYCYDTIKKNDMLSAAHKVKNCMDSSEHKNGETNMNSKQENVKKSVTKSVFDDFTVGTKRDENVLGFLNPLVDSDNKQKIVETKITDSFLGKYYGPSKTDLQPPTSLFKEINTDDIHRDIKEQDTPNIDIIHQLQSVADSTLKNVFDCKSPIVVESVLAKDIQEDFPIISNVAIDTSFTPFFDYQKPIFALPDTNNIKQSIIDHPVNVDSSHTFFDLQAPISNSLPRNKDDCNILNSATTQNATIGKTREMLSGPTDFNSLCPLLQSKSENLQTYASAAFAEKTSLNETPLFSLFEQPSLLPPLPSFDLSKISSISLPVPIKESIEIKNLETKLDNVSLYDNTENVIKFERKSSFFDKTLPVEDDTVYVDNQVSDLNICETCREVNKPEEKEADLTTQLIENITAPIQLANPVEFPVIASTSVPDISDFSNQFAEISYIPEDIIETMKQPPSVELKEDNFNSAITFGWSTGDSLPTKVTTDHDYSFQNDPNIIGFFDEKSLFFENVPTNASDEIKAEYKISQEDTIVLPRQLSIPTAPPEEDSNSDESGLDVHSIEQDAKNDFPIYEEFVIEPSETDDDKIEFKERERYSEDSPQEVDTFTNRVERFKQMETSTDLPDVNETQKATNALSLGTSSSPAITIASYFDTGNYAVENHYKNSLTSPPSVSFGANISSSTSIPPGFEEEYKRKCSGISSKDIPIGLNVGDIIFVPDTTTQTTVTACLTFTQPSNTVPTNVVTTDVSTRTTSFVPETVLNKTERLPAFSSIIKPKSETIEHEDKLSLVEKKATGTKPINDTSSEPINFFSSNEESNVNSDVYNNFSRLSSYFTTPPKPEHSKSFFELSQSQNHYRHKPDQFNSIQSKVKDFFDSSDLPKTESPDIPQNYLASMNLVRDLASHKTVTPKEDVVKIVNYFTVSYDIDNRNIGEPKSSIDITEKNIDKNTDGLTNRNYLYELGDIDETHFCIEDLLKQCSYCYDTIKKNDMLSAAHKVKNCMDSSEHKNGETNMNSKQENVKKSVTVNFCDSNVDETKEKIVVTPESRNSSDYAPVKHHWFYRVDYDGKSIWRGFSAADSRALENAFISPDLDETTVVATDGGRFDVNVVGRLRIPVYWTDKPSNVMRCSWFYKGNIDARYVPYAESDAEQLEEEYRHGVTTGEWHRRLMLPNHEMVVMHGPAVMVHFLQGCPTDGFGTASLFTFGKRVYRNPPKINVAGDQPNQIDHLIFLVHGAGEYRNQKEKLQSTMRPRVVRRGYVESEIEDTEPSSIDHLLLLCHGVGSACDMRFRSVEEVVDDFRTTSLQLIQSHYKNSYDSGVIGRVEVLPISWHSSLHSGETGVDRRLAAVTLESIPRLRNFTNDTILDVLFYTSPVYCQTIVNTVCTELNRIYNLFKKRNPHFKGGVSLGGHSLGSVILYDLLCHQMPESVKLSSPTKQYVSGTAGTGQPTVLYPGLVFQPDALYAFGSPIAIFECIRGVETLGQEFCLPTCKNFFNIFHPYDPIAYRLEPMINPLLRDVKPSLIPHHKGRKRMHLELKDTMVRVGADIKQKLIESIRSTWSSMWRTSPPPEQQLEKVVEEIEKEELTADTKEEYSQYEATPDTLGRLNNGRRIDHVLQEAPFEIFNEYLFAMTSHVCYWESEDTMLVMLHEIYNSLGVSPDCSLPQHTMTVERNRLLEDSDKATSSPGEFPSTSRGTS